ncbi:RDD family protein [Mycobacteroides abscessus MAB_030201_1075]|uniref:RDD family protein n=1 Tax=Mycobacteroides abscessus MAB_030201_1075 TaxID=1335410 RepID=A0A829PJ21_9MYCO|nr:RDD family protein [Mycobacteroides abscessus]ETZ70930.1 RDD family protein [Mycobacteroides abscessus MAB_110811_1470]ETZ88303.1 RDD family protein [Mycobacteroides abscessus MAB_030201_1075]ETZ92115.1 RDD family protein [Mycobacteroides abscessus MAB_030201_1061]SLJ02188.1 proline-rich antigen [Mycobacteroides abscessus subsp. abscessus]
MTEVPPPPPQGPGGYPPPPPAAGAPALPGGNFEIWIRRVGAALIDNGIAAVLYWIGYGIALATAEKQSFSTGVYDSDSMGGMSYGEDAEVYSFTGLGMAAVAIFTLGAIAFGLWNLKKQGDSGSTVGKNLLGIQVLGETTGQPIGFGMSFVRQLAHIIDYIICGIGFLLPLFTAKRQTIADMLVKTVVVPK